MFGGDVDRMLKESFARIREDIDRLTHEVETLKAQNEQILQQNSHLKSQLQHTKKSPYIEKLNKNRRTITLNRIRSLAQRKNLSIAEVKDIVVESEKLCSKATFYRYIEKLRKKNIIDTMMINELEVLVSI